MSHEHLNSIRAVGGVAMIEPATPSSVPIPIVATPTPMATEPTADSCAREVFIKDFRLPMTTRDIISSTSAGLALGKPKHCSTCSQRIRDTVGVPMMPEQGRGTMAVRMACVLRRIHSVIADSIFAAGAY